MTHDVIVVGARVAGAATAMLLARQGLRVLAVDRARFPSDTLSSHQLMPAGTAMLREWGLLDRLAATGLPPVRRIRFDVGDVVLHGEFHGDALYSPRRTILDDLLVRAARDAGAEVRDGWSVAELVRDGERVVGVRGASRGSDRSSGTERAALVIGADGKHSTVGSAVGARHHRQRGTLSIACYAYWSGLPITTGELYQRPGVAAAVFPTHDDLTMAYVAVPATELPAFRADPLRAYLAAADTCGDLGQRIRAATMAEHVRLAPDQPNYVADAHGPGWALVGDAGLALDSITAQGISNALRDAASLAATIGHSHTAGRPFDADLADHQRRRDQRLAAMYDFTVRLASFPRRSAAETALFRAIADRPAEINRFLGVFAGVEPMAPYFGLRNAARLMGAPTVARVALARARGR